MNGDDVIEEGKLADLVVLSANPLDDLRNSTSITHAMANGRLYDATPMNQVAPEPIARPTFWFDWDGLRMLPSGEMGSSTKARIARLRFSDPPPRHIAAFVFS